MAVLSWVKIYHIVKIRIIIDNILTKVDFLKKIQKNVEKCADFCIFRY